MIKLLRRKPRGDLVALTQRAMDAAPLSVDPQRNWLLDLELEVALANSLTVTDSTGCR